MDQFNVERSQEGDSLVLNLKGNVDEDTNFSGIDLSGSKAIVLDLKGIEAINSCGIREWIKWIKTCDDGSQIVYRNCPKVIVDQINMVAGFLPDNAAVESFFVPYYCDASGSEKMVLFSKGKEFSDSEVTPPEDVKCDDSGEEMEMDVIEAKYFRFLSK